MKQIPEWYADAARTHAEALCPGGTFVTTRQAAEIVGKGKSVAADFMKWLRAQPGGAPALTEALSTSDKNKTWTDDKSGVIFTDLGEYGVKHVTESEFRAIKRDYSRHYGGVALSRQEIALRYNFPTIKAFELFARVHELRQNGLPFTDTEIVEDGVEALVDKTIESQRQEFFLKLSEREREQQKRDAEKWRAFEVNARAIASELRGAAAVTSSPLRLKTPPAAHSPFAVFVSLSDVHYGKYDVDRFGDVVYNREIAARVVLSATRDLLTQTLMLGVPDEIILLAGGSDFLHADGPKLMTSSLQTQQGGQSDGTYRQMLAGGAALMVEVVKMCRAIAPVRLLEVPGNHDAQSSMFLAMLLREVFAGDECVTVEGGDGGRVLVEYGESSLYFLHGDALKKETDLFKLMLHDAGERGTHLRRHLLSFGGHFHSEKVTDLGGIKHHVCSALSGSDSWHREMGYVGSTREAQAFVIRKSGGKAAVLYSDPAALECPQAS